MNKNRAVTAQAGSTSVPTPPQCPPSGLSMPIKSFVLRAGRVTAGQKRHYDSLSGQFLVPFNTNTINYAAVFGNNNPVIVEIGFGMGQATALIAGENSGYNYLGIEVHRPGIGRLMGEIHKCALSNIRIIEHDAADVFASMIPPQSLEGIHLFFPDPWPKKRHHKRRLVQRPFTDTLAASLKPQGYLYMVTDWEDYATWALGALTSTEGLVNNADGFSPPLAWRPRTRFEQKGLEKNHKVRELFFRKI